MPRARARRGPRSAPARRRPARRARRPGRGSAGRRSGLVRLRGDLALPARRRDAGAAARRFLRAQSGHAEPAPRSSRPGRRASCMPRRRPIASARTSTARTCWKAACRPGRDRQRLAQPRARRAAAGGAGSQGRAAFAVGPVTPLMVRGTAPVLSWTPQVCSRPATTRIGAAAGSLPPHRPGLARAFAERHGTRRDRARGGSEDAADRPAGGATGRPARGARLFREAAGAAAQFLARAGRPAHRRARLRRLGHARQRRRGQRPAREAARRARCGARGVRDRHGRSVAGDGRR